MLKTSKRVISIRIKTIKNKRQSDLAGGIFIMDPQKNDFIKVISKIL